MKAAAARCVELVDPCSPLVMSASAEPATAESATAASAPSDGFRDGPMQSAYLLRQMKDRLRPTDVIVNTLPKCGQTWLTTLLMAIKLRGDLSSVKHSFDHIPWLEVPWIDENYKPIPLDRRIEQMQAVSDPRIFKMHVDWDQLPLPGDEELRRSIKIITITRDIRDLPYSFYRHIKAHDPRFLEAMKHPDIGDFDSFFNNFYLNKMFPPTGFISKFWEHRNDENVLVLRFEDMVKDTLGHAKKVIDFLGWEPLSDEVLVNDVLPVVSIENMKRIQYTQLWPGVFVPANEEHSFVREGKVGENRKRLTEEQIASLRQVFEEGLEEEVVKYWFRE